MHNMRDNLGFNAVTKEKKESWWKSGNNSKIALALVVSVTCGGYAASLTSSWMDDERSRYRLSLKQDKLPTPAMQKIVVASKSVKHGEELTRKNTKLINWAAAELPASAFKATNILFTDEGKRFALETLEANEPILGSKITAPGKGASLSAQLTSGKTAVTIRVDDVLGVGGLIVPNDRVDILWTSRPKGGIDNGEPYTEIIIPNVRVLALDQTVKEKTSNSRVARAVTIEVDIRQAQKVALGSQTGKLHLALRSHGIRDNQAAIFQRVTLSSLGSNSFSSGFPTVPVSTKQIKFDPSDVTASIGKPRQRSRKVTITRGLKKEQYDVVMTSSL